MAAMPALTTFSPAIYAGDGSAGRGGDGRRAMACFMLSCSWPKRSSEPASEPTWLSRVVKLRTD
jgi:hypothetical protein